MLQLWKMSGLNLKPNMWQFNLLFHHCTARCVSPLPDIEAFSHDPSVNSLSVSTLQFLFLSTKVHISLLFWKEREDSFRNGLSKRGILLIHITQKADRCSWLQRDYDTRLKRYPSASSGPSSSLSPRMGSPSFRHTLTSSAVTSVA